MEEFKPIATQEEFDQLVKQRLQREREKFSDYEQIKGKLASYEKRIGELTQTIESNKNNYQEKNKEIELLNSKIKGYELQQLKTKIAIENNLPISLADRLRGESEEDIKKDASLMGEYFSKRIEAPLRNVEAKYVNDETTAYRNLLQKLDLKGE